MVSQQAPIMGATYGLCIGFTLQCYTWQQQTSKDNNYEDVDMRYRLSRRWIVRSGKLYIASQTKRCMITSSMKNIDTWKGSWKLLTIQLIPRANERPFAICYDSLYCRNISRYTSRFCPSTRCRVVLGYHHKTYRSCLHRSSFPGCKWHKHA